MMDIENLYQELIIEHGTHPRNHTPLSDASHTAKGYNPLCGDKVQVYLVIEHDRIKKASFTSSGCAISTASASLMSEALVGKTIEEMINLSDAFKALLTTGNNPDLPLGKLAAFSGVNAFPARVKCATLPWHTLEAAIKQYANIP